MWLRPYGKLLELEAVLTHPGRACASFLPSCSPEWDPEPLQASPDLAALCVLFCKCELRVGIATGIVVLRWAVSLNLLYPYSFFTFVFEIFDFEN